jgi:hypothetical protein
MVRFVGVISAVLAASLVSTTHAQSWLPQAHECGNEIAKATGCGSCAGAWPAISECVARTVYPHATPAAVQQCIVTVNDQDWNTRRDRIADTLSCIARHN